ncbi:MAG: response regulator [Candidatus Krumholzibacteriia bacterium]
MTQESIQAQPIVYLIEDDALVRKALARYLVAEGLRCEDFATGQEFLDAYEGYRPACLVTDLQMPGLTGIDVQQALGERGWRLPVIFITGYGDVPRAVTAMKGGAVDFIEKPFQNEVLVEAVRRALVTEEELLGRERAALAAAGRLQGLTPRERQVLNMVVEGKANKVIASELELSIKTVEFHRAHVMQKMGVESVAELVQQVVAARDAGLDPAPEGEA